MKLLLMRKIFTTESTIGDLFVDGRFECYTLEDRVRPVKIPRVTAIPMGSYRVEITYSKKFIQLMPLLINVPHFQGVRIHSGNTADDTDGCILVGQVKGENHIGRSRLAYKPLFKKLYHAWLRKEPIAIDIVAEAPATLEDASRAIPNIC